MVIASLLRAGYNPLIPAYTDNARYDIVLETMSGRFLRVQIKTGRWIESQGVINFPTCSSQYHRGRGAHDYREQADYFAVYAPEFDRIYWVPVADAGTRQCNLRLRPTSNGQAKGIRPAEMYERLPD